jgi:hypothetical protein
MGVTACRDWSYRCTDTTALHCLACSLSTPDEQHALSICLYSFDYIWCHGNHWSTLGNVELGFGGQEKEIHCVGRLFASIAAKRRSDQAGVWE